MSAPHFAVAETAISTAAKTRYQTGAAHLKQRQYQEAIHAFTQALKHAPSYALAYRKRGETYQALGNSTAALEDCSKAIALSPTHSQAYNCRGNAHTSAKRYEQGIKDYLAAIERDPKYAWA